MKIFADLHIHSKYSRATSRELTIENLEKYAKIKGLNLLGTGDFTHPLWLRELKEKLNEDGSGFLKTNSNFNFVLQTEVSLKYVQDNKLRQIHLIVLSKSFDIVDQINEELSKYGNLDIDGRPTLNIYAPEFVEKIKEIDEDNEIIPAHIWTPWFGLFGSKSGFDSVEECFQDKKNKIYALETGLSSDPEMNWRLSSLDKFTLVSNSDAHSFWPWRLGREANVFDIKLNYKSLLKAIRSKENFLFTIEVDPAYGKYHYDGHRKCNFSINPKDAMKMKNICPICNKKLTIGVLHRVEELADRESGYKPKNAIPFYRLIPLSDIISKVYKSNNNSKKVWNTYMQLVDAFGSEFNVLLKAKKEELEKVCNSKIAGLILKNREGKLKVKPGYDGVYGQLIINEDDEKKIPQKFLDEFY